MFTDRSGKRLENKEAFERILVRMRTVIRELAVYVLFIVGMVPIHHVRRIVYRLAGIKIGKGSAIHMGARFYNPENIIIGNDSIIGEGVVLDGRAKLRIGDHVDIASEVMIYNSEHKIDSDNFAAADDVIQERVEIDDYAFIGPRAIILPGVKVGRGAIIGAGAVVTRDVEPFSVVGGVPAKKIGERKNKNPTYILGRAAWFR